MSKAGYKWDALNSRWKPVNYILMTDEELQSRRDEASDRLAEVEAQLVAFIPQAEAMSLLNSGMESLQDLLIKLASKSPEVLLKLITGA